MTNTKWYSISAVLRHFVESDDVPDHFEFVVFVVAAESTDEAVTRGKQCAHMLEFRSRNEYGHPIGAVFEEVVDAYPMLDEVRDGAEVYSRFFNVDQIQLLRQRSFDDAGRGLISRKGKGQ